MSCLLFASCASANIEVQKKMTISPGEIRWLEMELESNNVKLFCRNNEVKLQKENSKYSAIVMETYFSNLKPFKCAFKDDKKILASIDFTVKKKKYLSEKLKVDPKRIKLSPEDQKRVDDEQIQLNKIYASSLDKIQFSSSFTRPLPSHITSVYGTRRVYNGHKIGQHLGVDFRAAIGEPVPSTNAGKVVYAGDLFYTGWTVIIDHGLDIFSVYGHLSKTNVVAGQFVEKGEVIGLSGNSGRTSGPHLHWGMKVQGQYIDGLVLIEETNKKFER